MKTNNYKIPWEENQNDQGVDSNNLNKAKDQLVRDVMRFMELLPDLRMTDIEVRLYAAFPLADDSCLKRPKSSLLLTKNDIQDEQDLLEKVGLHDYEKPTDKVKTLCKKHGVPVIKAGHTIRFTQDSVDRLLEAMTWRYTSYEEEASTTSTTPFRGVTSQSAYGKLQAELQKQKRGK